MNHVTLHNFNTSDEWASLPTGSLAGFAKQDRNRRRKAISIATLPVVLLAVLLGTWAVLGTNVPDGPQRLHPEYLGGISCLEVIKQTDLYLVGQFEDDYLARIEQHLLDCPSCLTKYDRRAEEQGLEFPLGNSIDGAVAFTGPTSTYDLRLMRMKASASPNDAPALAPPLYTLAGR